MRLKETLPGVKKQNVNIAIKRIKLKKNRLILFKCSRNKLPTRIIPGRELLYLSFCI